MLVRIGLEVSIVRLGTVFSGNMRSEGRLSRKIDEKTGIAKVVAASEAGSTPMDAAPVYGGAWSERIMGRAQEGYDPFCDTVKRSVEVSWNGWGGKASERRWCGTGIGSMSSRSVRGKEAAFLNQSQPCSHAGLAPVSRNHKSVDGCRFPASPTVN